MTFSKLNLMNVRFNLRCSLSDHIDKSDVPRHRLFLLPFLLVINDMMQFYNNTIIF